MKSNISLQELGKQVEKYNTKTPKKTYDITRLVMNFNGKICVDESMARKQ